MKTIRSSPARWQNRRNGYEYAQTTSDSTEYNLYSETEHFHIWLRLITRNRDYNLYCLFFKANKQ